MRQRQQSVNQLSHFFHAGLDAGQVVLHFAVLLITELPGQQPGQTIDRDQGRAQVVRDRVGKRFQFRIGQPQGRLGRLDFSHVHINANPEYGLAGFVKHRRHPVGHEAVAAIRRAQSPGSGVGGARLNVGLPGFKPARQIIRMHQIQPGRAVPLRWRATKKLVPGLADKGGIALPINRPDRIRCMLGERAEQRLLAG